MTPIGVLPQAGRVEFDHVFIVVQPEAVAEIRALRSAGLTVPTRTAKHDGEGTTSAAVVFENAYLELMWIDASLSVDAEHTASARSFRDAAAWRTTGHSPFGLGLRRIAGDSLPLPVPVQRELAPWLGPDAAYELLRQPSEARATDFFVVPAQAAVPTWVDRARTRAPEDWKHARGERRITRVRLHGPAAYEPAAFRLLRPKPIEMIRAAEPLLEIELDNAGHRQRLDLRPVLPLVLVR